MILTIGNCTSLHANLSVKLKYLEKDIERRREIADYYLTNINNQNVILPKLRDKNNHVWHLFVIRTEKRDKLQKYLLDNRIQTVIHYPIAPHHQQAYAEWNNNTYPISEQVNNQVLSLPIGQHLSMDDIKLIVDIINKY